MIKLQELTPSVYYNQSRDFQFIGRLYDIVLNSVKTNAELINSLPLNEDIDNKLLDLVTMTLGFKSLHDYNTQQLRAICSAFSEIIKNKGNITSIIKACTVLVNAEGITDAITIDEPDYDTNSINIYIPQSIDDVNLLKDLLDYILPAGMTYNLIKQLRINKEATTEISVNGDVTYNLNYADEKSITKASLIKDQAIEINNNFISNIAGVLLNTTVTNTTEMVNIKIKEPERGGGKIELNSRTGRTKFAAWEPIPIKVTADTGKKLHYIWYKIESGNKEPLYEATEPSKTDIIVWLPQSINWHEVALKNWTVYLIPEFEEV